MTMPSFVAFGVGSESAPAVPAGHAADDMFALPIETATETPNTSTGGTWIRQTLAGSRSDTKLTFDYRFVASGAEPPAGIGATANHIWGQLLAFRNVDMTNPFAAISCGQFASTTSGFSSKLLVPVPQCLIACIITGSLDAVTMQLSAAANASLANVAIRLGVLADTAGTTTGNGGCLGVITGEFAAGGDMEAFTWTLGAASACSTTIYALRPNAEVAVSKNVKDGGSNVPNASNVVTLYNLTCPADPPYTGIAISGGAGNWSTFVRYSGHTYLPVYDNGTRRGAGKAFVA